MRHLKRGYRARILDFALAVNSGSSVPPPGFSIHRELADMVSVASRRAQPGSKAPLER